MTRTRLGVQLLAVCGLLVGCASGSSGDEAPAGGSTAAAATGDGAAAAQDSVLRAAAEGIVAFLRGTADYATLRLADTVALVLPAEGGGTRRRVSRDALRDRHAWTVSATRQRYSFVPAVHLTRMRVAPGRHFTCLEGPLSARVPEFGEAPHVGVRLEPPEPESCLQGWNATFVFDTTPGQPRLVAAIYDQWEW